MNLISKTELITNPNKDDHIYWSVSKSRSNQNKPADLETTAYVLLSRLIDSENDLNALAPIAKWINSQRNSFGGFYSTQVNFILFFF